jgi:NADH-quinone oxidoreductase subunit M
MYQRTMTGPKLVGARAEQVRDLDRREVVAIAPLFVALVVFGFFPMPLLKVINPYIADTLQHVGVHDPSPTVAAGTSTGPAQGGQP